MPRQRILVVEDEDHLLTFYRETLEQAGYRTQGARTGAEALTAFSSLAPHLIILDLNLEGEMDGFEVLSILRRRSDVPVIILTGLPGEERLVRGLRLGADNYLQKPVSRGHLIARVQAQLRRSPSGELVLASGVYHYGSLILDLDRSLAIRGEQRFTFGEAEKRLLARLLQTPGQPVSHLELLQAGWGFAAPEVTPTDMRLLQSCIYRLRAKLERKGGQTRLIESVFNVGFSIVCPDEMAETTPAPAALTPEKVPGNGAGEYRSRR